MPEDDDGRVRADTGYNPKWDLRSIADYIAWFRAGNNPLNANSYC